MDTSYASKGQGMSQPSRLRAGLLATGMLVALWALAVQSQAQTAAQTTAVLWRRTRGRQPALLRLRTRSLAKPMPSVPNHSPATTRPCGQLLKNLALNRA